MILRLDRRNPVRFLCTGPQREVCFQGCMRAARRIGRKIFPTRLVWAEMGDLYKAGRRRFGKRDNMSWKFWRDGNYCNQDDINYMYSRNLSAPAFAADFPPDAPKFNQRTLHVRLINLCTSDKKSSHKIRHSEIPRVHLCFLKKKSIL